MITDHVPTSRLRAALLAFLTEAPRTTDEMSMHFGHSGPTVRYYLRGLEEDGLIHHQKFFYTNGGGSYFVWFVGIRTANISAYPAPLAGKPARPAGKVRRDPLVAALFGAPAAAPERNHP